MGSSLQSRNLLKQKTGAPIPNSIMNHLSLMQQLYKMQNGYTAQIENQPPFENGESDENSESSGDLVQNSDGEDTMEIEVDPILVEGYEDSEEGNVKIID